MQALSVVIPIRLSEEDYQALTDRTRIECSNQTAIARTAIRWYLTKTRPIQKPPAA